MRWRLLYLLPLALVLSACQSSAGLGSGSGTGAASASSASAMASASSNTSFSGSARGSSREECRASQFQNLVGTSGDGVNRGNLPQNTRVLRPTTPMSPDYRPDRMNVYINDAGQVEKVVCG